MLRSILMGLVAGQRSMTPLAALAGAAQRGTLPHDNAEARLMEHPLIAAGGAVMAVAEMAGDKMKTAPDRTVLLGLLARTITGGFAGAASRAAEAATGRRRTGHRRGGRIVLCRSRRTEMGDAAVGPDADRIRGGSHRLLRGHRDRQCQACARLTISCERGFFPHCAGHPHDLTKF